MKRKIKKIWTLSLAICALSTPAFAQSMNDAWSFNTQNRASIAALMKQVHDSKSQAATTSTSGGATTLICGGGSADSNSSAMGNSSCIILNNSTGSIEIGQDSIGDQSASADSEVSTNFDSTDDVLSTLNGND